MIAKLPRETEEQIQRLIDTGEYHDTESVVVQAVDDFVRRHEKLDRLRALLQVGLDDIAAGRVSEWTPELMHQIRTEARTLAASNQPLDPEVSG